MYEKARALVKSELFKQSWRFIVVGLIATIINYIVNQLLIEILYKSKDYAVLTLHLFSFSFPLSSISISGGTGFLAGVVAGFPLNKLWSFESKDQASLRETGLYLFVYFVTFIVTMVLSPWSNFFFTEIFNLESMIGISGLNNKIYYLPVIAVTTVLNFAGCKLLVFKR